MMKKNSIFDCTFVLIYIKCCNQNIYLYRKCLCLASFLATKISVIELLARISICETTCVNNFAHSIPYVCV